MWRLTGQMTVNRGQYHGRLPVRPPANSVNFLDVVVVLVIVRSSAFDLDLTKVVSTVMKAIEELLPHGIRRFERIFLPVGYWRRGANVVVPQAP